MIRGIYSAATGLEASSLQQDMTAQNLANSTMPGYRRRGAAFETFERALAAVRPELVAEAGIFGTQPYGTFNSFEPGPFETTGNPLDAAINDNGTTFFVVESPQGPLYTRNGSFQLNEEGQLLTKSGLPVRGQGGPITIPPGTVRVQIAQDGTVLADAGLGQPGVPVSNLELAQFTNPHQLRQIGPSLFQGGGGAIAATPGTYRIEQGHREGSNVQVVNEMVSMIAGLRHYEAAQRALRAISDAVQQNTRPER